LKPYVVIEDFRESDFHNLKGTLKDRGGMTNIPTQAGTKEALQIDTPDGNITITYYNSGKLMIQGSPSNAGYVWLATEVEKYSKNRVIGKI